MKQTLLSVLSCIAFLFAVPGGTMAQLAIQGPSSSQTPYLVPVATGVRTTSVLTVTDDIGGYKMAGIPDGLGAFDNGDGTFTLLMNHELGNTLGNVRAHGGRGAFVSSWIIRKNDLTVLSGADLIQSVYGWNSTIQSNDPTGSIYSFTRFCSADLPKVSAYYDRERRLGTEARIFMHGEEGGTTGYQLATVASGPNKGKTYILGKFNLSTNGSGLTGVGAWENALACPYPQPKTIVIGNNDGGTGIMNNSVSVYIGTKTNTGTEVDKAGLMNGILRFINVTGNPVEIVNTTTRATNIVSGTRFTLSGTSSTTFSRPEDGFWNPEAPNQFFFVTTDRLDQVADGIGTQIGRSRLWRLTFDDIANPELGGTIDLLLDGTEGQNMMDNITVDKKGNFLLLQEDVGNAAHNGKIWKYSIADDELTLVTQHDVKRFGDITTPATAPFNQDEESSGIIDVQDILGDGWFLLDDQAHYTTGIPSFAVEGGQLVALFIPKNGGKVDICHKGNTITVDENAVKAHLAHGDKIGKCDEDDRKDDKKGEGKDDDAERNGKLASSTSLTDLNTTSKVSIYPNPVQNTANVNVSVPGETLVSINVVDLQGRMVIKGTQQKVAAGSRNIQINTSALTNGVYYVEVSHDNKKTVQRIMVSR